MKEFEEKKIDLKENLLTDMDEKRKMIETDRHTMELTGDSMEVRGLDRSAGFCSIVTCTHSFARWSGEACDDEEITEAPE